MTAPRPEVVGALIDGIAAGMRGDEFARIADQATELERAEAARLLARSAILAQQQTRTIMDLTMVELATLAAVWAVLSRWEFSRFRPDYKLSDAMKVMPTNDVAVIERLAIAGGFARASDPGEQPGGLTG
jgi:hypothetical protein